MSFLNRGTGGHPREKKTIVQACLQPVHNGLLPQEFDNNVFAIKADRCASLAKNTPSLFSDSSLEPLPQFLEDPFTILFEGCVSAGMTRSVTPGPPQPPRPRHRLPTTTPTDHYAN